VGIPDEQSYWRTSYLPGGRATGWRLWFLRGIALLFAVGILVIVVVTVVQVATRL
jgi:hypothetical protein